MRTWTSCWLRTSAERVKSPHSDLGRTVRIATNFDGFLPSSIEFCYNRARQNPYHARITARGGNSELQFQS